MAEHVPCSPDDEGLVKELALDIAQAEDIEMGCSTVFSLDDVTVLDIALARRVLASPAIAMIRAAAVREAVAVVLQRDLTETGRDLEALAATYDEEARRG